MDGAFYAWIGDDCYQLKRESLFGLKEEKGHMVVSYSEPGGLACHRRGEPRRCHLSAGID